jgi:cold-inducible RNA-binding protein
MNKSKLYVGNVNYSADNRALVEFFSQFGEVVEVMLIPDVKSGKHKGYGFITFADPKAAKAALGADGQEFMGRNLKISMAKNP